MHALATTVCGIVSATSRLIDRLVAALCFAIVYLMLALLMTQVLMRYFLGSPPSWTEELAIILFAWLVLLFASVGVRGSFHVALDTLPERFRRLRSLSNLLVHGLVAVFSMVMIRSGYAYVEATLPQNTAALQIPIGFLYASVPISGALMLLHSISMVMEQLMGIDNTEKRISQDIPE